MTKPISKQDILLEWGTKASIILLFVCIVFSAFHTSLVSYRIFICPFLKEIETIEVERLNFFNLTVQQALCFTGIFIGMAFACLGFALFLIKAQGTFSINAANDIPKTGNEGTGWSAVVQASAPGLAVILCATVIVCFSINQGWRAKNREK